MLNLKKNIIFRIILFFITILLVTIIFNNYYLRNFVKPKFTHSNVYEISAEQFNAYKSNSINLILEKFVLEQNNNQNQINSYQLINTKIAKSIPFFTNPRTIFNAKLLLKDFVDPKEVQSKINIIYYDEINTLTNEFKKNNYLFSDPIYTPENYVRLSSSDFFKNYLPPQFCSFNKVECYEEYSQYYLSTFFQLENERSLVFQIKFLEDRNANVKENQWIRHLPINLAFALLITYIFFLLTTKFLRKRRK